MRILSKKEKLKRIINFTKKFKIKSNLKLAYDSISEGFLFKDDEYYYFDYDYLLMHYQIVLLDKRKEITDYDKNLEDFINDNIEIDKIIKQDIDTILSSFNVDVENNLCKIKIIKLNELNNIKNLKNLLNKHTIVTTYIFYHPKQLPNIIYNNNDIIIYNFFETSLLPKDIKDYNFLIDNDLNIVNYKNYKYDELNNFIINDYNDYNSNLKFIKNKNQKIIDVFA
jgi:hypothetical protein